MAFQTGTRINPQLGALDFSGFTNAANIQAKSLASLGKTIGSAIAANKEKKQEKALSEQAANMVFSFSKTSEIGEQLGIENLEDAKIVVKTLGGAKPTIELLMELQELNQEDSSLKPVSDSSMRSAEARVGEMGFEYNPKARTFQKTIGPGFARSLGNMVLPGQPFGSPRTVDLPQEIIDTTTGLPQFLEQKRALDNVEMNRMQDDDDPMGIF